MAANEVHQTVEIQALKLGLDPSLVLAFCETESAFRFKSARYEKRFIWIHEPELYAHFHKVTLDTEVNFQKTSWGILHIMGGTARFIGFGGWLPDLSSFELGLEWGCRYIAHLHDKYITQDDLIAAYNAGSPKRMKDGTYANQNYVNKVKLAYLKYKNGGKK